MQQILHAHFSVDGNLTLYRYWHKLGYDFPCPIHFTKEEIRIHREEGEGWNEAQDFWDAVAHIVSRDGWTPNHLYNDAAALFAGLRETGLKSMAGKEREDFQKQTQWLDEASQAAKSAQSRSLV